MRITGLDLRKLKIQRGFRNKKREKFNLVIQGNEVLREVSFADMHECKLHAWQ